MKNNKIFSSLPAMLIGEVFVVILISLVFFVLDKFDYTVILGAVFGAVVNIICFMILCLTVEKMIRDNEQNKAKGIQMFSYMGRMGLMALGIAIGFKVSFFNGFAVAVPMLTTRLILSAEALLKKEKGEGEQ